MFCITQYNFYPLSEKFRLILKAARFQNSAAPHKLSFSNHTVVFRELEIAGTLPFTQTPKKHQKKNKRFETLWLPICIYHAIINYSWSHHPHLSKKVPNKNALGQ